MDMKLEDYIDEKPARGVAVVKVAELSTALGSMTACVTDSGVCLLEFSDAARLPQRINRLRKRSGRPLVVGRHTLITQLKRELKAYFSGNRKLFEVPVVLDGTAFQTSVWHVLSKSRYGDTMTYADLANRAGKPDAIRAAAAANGANALSILVPCHRVRATSGNLTGYSGGLERKAWLLALESKKRSP